MCSDNPHLKPDAPAAAREKDKRKFVRHLAKEIANNIDVISEIFIKSRVGQCGGRCRGFGEEDLSGLCEDCFRALQEESDKIFSLAPGLRLLGDAMNNQN